MKRSFRLPAFLPDQTDNSGVLTGIKNAYPITDGYAPVGSFQPISEAFTGTFLGGGSFVSPAGVSYLLVGTDTQLLRYTAGAWTELVGGLTISDRWNFQDFGEYVIAVNGAATYEVNLTAGTAQVLANAPAGKSIAEIGGYLAIGQGLNRILDVSTAVINTHTSWVPDVGATQQEMLKGGEVMGIAGGEYGVVLQRRRLVRMDRTGIATSPFDYNEITNNVGCASKGSIAQYGRSVMFLSDQGFISLESGQDYVPIGSEQVDRDFQSRVPTQSYEDLFAAIDPVRKLAIWCLPGRPGQLWVYNYEIRRWGYAELNIEGIFAAFTSSQTLEEVSAANPDLDAMTVSLDDPMFKGGSPQLYVVQDGRVGALSGPALEAMFEHGFAELMPGRAARVREIRPVTDAVFGQSFTDRVSLRQGDVGSLKTASSIRPSGVMPIRATGRYHRFTWNIAAGFNWNYAQAFEVEYSDGGDR